MTFEDKYGPYPDSKPEWERDAYRERREIWNAAIAEERASIIDWLAHRCSYCPPCGVCIYCRVAATIRAREP